MTHEILVLPPQPTPKQLTAQYRIKHLGEHYMAFLNANNLSGFKEDLTGEPNPNSVFGIMLEVLEKEEITKTEFKKLSFRLTNFIRTIPGKKKFSIQRGFQTIAHVMGYRTYDAIIALFFNRGIAAPILHDVASGQRAIISGEKATNKLTKPLMERMRERGEIPHTEKSLLKLKKK